MSETIKKNEYVQLDGVQALRGIAAMLVVLLHYRVDLNNRYTQSNLGELLFGQGYIGVDLFFVVSGFIIVYATHGQSLIVPFLIKRFLRVVPLAWATTIVMYLLWPQATSTKLLEGLAFFPSDPSTPPSSDFPFCGHNGV